MVGILDGFEGLVRPGRTHPLYAEEVRGLLPRGGTILGSTNRGSFHVPADRDEPVTCEAQDEVKRRFRALQIAAQLDAAD